MRVRTYVKAADSAVQLELAADVAVRPRCSSWQQSAMCYRHVHGGWTGSD